MVYDRFSVFFVRLCIEKLTCAFVEGELFFTGCVSLTTEGSGGTAHTCSGRHSLCWVPGVALHSL